MIPHDDNERMSAWLERAWLERYLERALSDEESAWFEAYVLDKPELLRAIEADTDLRDGIVAAANDSSRAIESSPRRPHGAFATANWWLSLAAVLVVGVGMGTFLRPMLATKPGEAVIANPARIVYDTMRGKAMVPQFDPVGLEADVWLFEVAVPATARNIQLELAGKPPTRLAASPDSFVSFVIPREHARALRSALVTYDNESTRIEVPISFPP